jgi:hypothetical protein
MPDSSSFKDLLKLSIFFSFLLASCAPRMPVYIDEVWTNDPPMVGKIVTLGLKVKSVSDEDNIIFVLRFPGTVFVDENPLRWEFGLKADQEKDIYADICVLETGSWLIDASIASYLNPKEMKYGDRRVLGLESYPSEAKVILEKDIVYSQGIETERASMPHLVVPAEACQR